MKRGVVRGIEEALGVATFAVAYFLLFGQLIEWSFDAAQPFLHRLPRAVVHVLGYGGYVSLGMLPAALVLGAALGIPMVVIFKRRRLLYAAIASLPVLCLEVGFLERSRMAPTFLWSALLVVGPILAITAVAARLTSRYGSAIPSFNIAAKQAESESATSLSIILVGDLWILVSLGGVIVASTRSAERDLPGLVLFVSANIAGLLCAVAFRNRLKWSLPAYAVLCAAGLALATIKVGPLPTPKVALGDYYLLIIFATGALNWKLMSWSVNGSASAPRPESEGRPPRALWPSLLAAAFFLLLPAVCYLIYDDQYTQYQRESSGLASDIKQTQVLLERASALAPQGDDDLSALNIALASATGELSIENEAFAIPSVVETQIRQQFSSAVAKNVKVVQVRPLDVQEKDFYREHSYVISLVGERDAVVSTALHADAGPLLISWTRMQSLKDERGEEMLQLMFTVYSLVEDRLPAALPACSPPQKTAVWLPWLQQQLRELSNRRESLCTQGRSTPLRTARILQLSRVDEHKTTAQIVVGTVRKHRGDVTSLVTAESRHARR